MYQWGEYFFAKEWFVVSLVFNVTDNFNNDSDWLYLTTPKSVALITEQQTIAIYV